MDGFSERIVLPYIPEGPGVCIIENEAGECLNIAYSANVRSRIGKLLDSISEDCSHGPNVYKMQKGGERVYVRWKFVDDYKKEKKRLLKKIHPKWK